MSRLYENFNDRTTENSKPGSDDESCLDPAFFINRTDTQVRSN
jgi:hypothetical protein